MIEINFENNNNNNNMNKEKEEKVDVIEEEEGCLFDQINYTDTTLECWPDHITPKSIVLDDVSRLNATKVYSLNQVRSIGDIQSVLKLAEKYNQEVSIRGTKHSMGGQTLNQNGVVIDMKYISHMNYSSSDNTVTVGTGCMWSDLIIYLNQFAKAPRTLQSYCSFSVGGTLSVNGHGITTDYTLSESVQSFTLIKASGDIIECSRDSNDPEAKELFSLCIGGYGLFGVIYQVTLKVKDNHRLAMDTIMIPVNELPYVYEPMIDSMNAQEIEIKLARIDITNFDVADIYIFRRVSNTPTISNLPSKPKEMSMASKTMYKWFAGPLRELRFKIEHSLGIALDWSEVNDSNSLLFESAKPLAILYSPWLLIDDTFILQEYFVPRDNYNTWISQIKDIVLKELSKETTITLLNITIRFVHQDTDSAIPYATSINGSYAFVFYFRIRRTSEADKLLKSYHKKFTNITLQEGGTFYLPYRHHYTRSQLQKAYPNFNKFKQQKLKFDPNQRFSSLWWNHYGKNQLNDNIINNQPQQSIIVPKPISNLISNNDDELKIQQLIENTEIHRKNSFRELMKDSKQRQTFIETFLVEFLALTNNNSLMRIINSSLWDSRLKDDNEIYMKIIDALSQQSGPLSEIMKVWNLVKQLAEQKRELVRETVSVLSHIGKVEKIHDIVSIGDHGKLITPLRNALKCKGKTWIVHDDIDADETNVGATLERGTIDKYSLGTCIKIDYLHIKKDGREFQEIPDASVDLVTVNQGLHHLPPKQITHFLRGIYRILRPGGCFITREHDLDDDRKLIPMLDCAHMVFNALTGVQPAAERDEIRGFRSLKDWRLIIESCGFQDTMIYEMQANDPTIDMMMCFRKLPFDDNQPEPERTFEECKSIDSNKKETTESKINSILNQAPHITLSFIKDALKNLNIMLPKIQTDLTKAIRHMVPSNVPGVGDAVELLLNSYINPMITMLSRFEPLTEAAIPKINTSVNIIPEELTLLIDVLRARSKKNASVVEIAIVGIIDQLIGIKDEVIAEVKQEESIPHPANLLQQSIRDPIFIADIKQELSFILRDIPEFYDIPNVISEIGLPPRGSELLLGLLPEEPSIESFTKWFADKLDTHAWIQLKSAFTEIRGNKELPKLEQLLKQGSSWNRVAMSILSSSTIQFTAMQKRMAGWVGLGDIIEIWSKAQEERLKRSPNSNASSSNLSKPILEILDKISPIQTYEGKATTLSNVLCIVSAKHIHYSITGLFKSVETDITNEANECLCLKNGSLDLSETRPSLKKFTSFRAGESNFIVEYRTIPDTTNTQKFKTNGSKLSNLLAKQGYIDGNHHVDRDALNHYKLPEWMQVDLVQSFGEFMNHTPWYRYPFMNVLKSYFDVLFREFSHVSQKTGLMQALCDQGFITDLVPGIVMSLILGQMYLLALPLRKIVGESYDESKLYEELLVISPHSSKWNEIDSRISNVRSLGHGLFSFQIPTFKPFTEVILNLARNSILTTILQISNNVSIQVKLETSLTNLTNSLKTIENFGEDVKINFNYNLFPKELAEKSNVPQQISIDILVQSLSSFIRYIDNFKDIKISQIYDFY